MELSLDGFTLALGTVEAAKRVHGVEAVPGSAAMVLVLWTDDVDTTFETLVAAGTPVVQPPHDTGNNNRNALLRDPDAAGATRAEVQASVDIALRAVGLPRPSR